MVLQKLYAESLARFQGGSPYIYPLYGLGELPQVIYKTHYTIAGKEHASGISVTMITVIIGRDLRV